MQYLIHNARGGYCTAYSKTYNGENIEQITAAAWSHVLETRLKARKKRLFTEINQKRRKNYTRIRTLNFIVKLLRLNVKEWELSNPEHKVYSVSSNCLPNFQQQIDCETYNIGNAATDNQRVVWRNGILLKVVIMILKLPS